MAVAWVLNLDADHELRRPAGYSPTAAVTARVRDLVPRLAGLVRPEDVVIDDGAPPSADRGWPGRYLGLAWCPTPRALRMLARAGIRAAPAPSLEVLQRVNHRRFCSDLGQTLPGAERIESSADLVRMLAQGGSWVLKRPFSIAGNSRRILRAPELTDPDAAWVQASFRDGESLQVEPWLELAGEYALHGYLSRSGHLTSGEVCTQLVDEFGAWLRSERASDLTPEEQRALAVEMERVATALRDAGYHGPFGVDAYRYRTGEGLRFNPRSEINARYTMGWAVGMGDRRPDLHNATLTS